DEVAVTAAVPAGTENGAVGGRVNRSAIRTREVDARVHCRRAAERIGADAVAAGEGGCLDRLVGRDRNGAGGKIVELLPAGEKLLERRISITVERAASAFL